MKIICRILILFALPNLLMGQVIPDGRRVDWKAAQLNFSFSEPETVLNVNDFGLTGDGETDNSSIFERLIETINEQSAVLYFPSGTYLFKSTISLDDSLVIRGDGAGKTIFLFDLGGTNGNGITISGRASNENVLLDGGFYAGSRKIYTDSAFLFHAGQMIELIEDNGSWDTKPASWAIRVVGQLTLVDSVINDTLYLHSPLRIDYDRVLHPLIRTVQPVVNSGVECLTLKRLDEPPTGGGYNVFILYARNCRIKGIESDTSVAAHVYITKSLNIRVTGSYFHHAFKYDGKFMHGYGVAINHHASECVVENNIFKHLRHAMMVKTGANGNIFGYNFSTDVYRIESPHDRAGDISLHGHYPFANLFEGNVVQNIILDHHWGPSGPYNTLLRNRAYNWGILFTQDNEMESSKQNITGNETTDFAPSHGIYDLSGDNHFEYGNNILNSIIPAGTNSIPDTSCYWPKAPFFWNIPDIWPAIGIPNHLSQGKIPAQVRYENEAEMTVCNDSTVNYTQSNTVTRMHIWPNPTHGIFHVKWRMNGKASKLILFNTAGVRVYSQTLKQENGMITVNVKNLPNGLYNVVVIGNRHHFFAKILIL